MDKLLKDKLSKNVLVLFNEYDRPDMDKLLEVDVCAVPSWTGFDKLLQFLKNVYSVEVIKCFDGPDDTRVCELKAEGQEFELRHYDFPLGNSIVATVSTSKDIVRRIGLDLENRLKDC